MKKVNQKKLFETEMEIGYDLIFSEKFGKDCYCALALNCIEEYEHCGYCD